MAQSSWTYPDEKGNHHSVGLYHGDRSGHFILYCNKRVVAIDFKVFESKTYSFMINDELCEVFLKKQADGSFDYDFKINEDIDTPSNNKRKKKRAFDKKTSYIFWGVFTALVLGFTFGMRYFQGNERKKQFFGLASHYVGSKYEAKDLRMKGLPATATLIYDTKATSTAKIQYELQSPQGAIESDFEEKTQDGTVWLPNGFPLASGDAFYAVYYPEAMAEHHAIEYKKPTGETLLRYFDLVVASEQKFYRNEDAQKIACRINIILKERGLDGLALLLHRNTTATQNALFNQDAANEMLKSRFLIKKIEEACSKER